MPEVKMLVSALTDVGRARTTNEDAFAVTDLASGEQIEAAGADHAIDVRERGVLLALSDGMGGHQAGEVASALVLESLGAALQDDSKGAIHEQLEEAVQRANRSVLSAAKSGNRRGMGATLTAVFVRGGEAYIAEVGDSRGYLLRNGRLRQITRDQSLVQLMVDHGVLSAEEARRSPSRNVILQAVGLADDVRVAIARLELRRGDRFLLCSDGVTNAVSDEELRQILTGSDPRAACETMIGLANDRGGDDNETAIVADLHGEGLDPPDEFETVTSTYEVLKAYEATIGGKPVTATHARLAAASVGARPEPAPPAPAPGVLESLPDLPTDDAEAAAAPAPAAPSGPAAAPTPRPADAAPSGPGATHRIRRARVVTTRVLLTLIVAGMAVAAIAIAATRL
jgi:PPM family protein phosphatase